MGQQLLSLCLVETRRLQWLMGMMIVVIIVFQCFELPYGNVILPLFSAGRVWEVGNSTLHIGNSPSKPEMIRNMTLLNGSNSTDTYAIHERANNTGTSKGMARNPKNGFISDRNGSSHKSLGLDVDNHANESSSENRVWLNKNSTVAYIKNSSNVSAPQEAKEPQKSFYQNDGKSSVGEVGKGTNTTAPEDIGRSGADSASPSPALAPINSSSNPASTIVLDTNIRTPVVDSNMSILEKNGTTTSESSEKSGQSQIGLTPSGNNPSVNRVPELANGHEIPTSPVISISGMNDLLLQSHHSYQSMAPRRSSAVDQELLYAKSLIENAPLVKNDPKLYAPLYRNVSMFKRSYELMEDTLKVYIYKEGEKPIFHQPPLKGIYASEGWFMKLLEANKKLVTKNPRKAHLFYLPFSSRALEITLYVPNSHRRGNLIQYLKNYLDMIAVKHPFWNRTAGADHFLVACHDWAPDETKKHMAKCIRALCNADMKEGFIIGKDVSLPETYVRLTRNPLRDVGGNPPSRRPILAFFAGNMHGYVRPILLKHWGNKDPDMKIFGRMADGKGNKKYIQHMKSSKYCVCAKGYEVNSPRVVEAIFYECVPVIISDNFVPPFFEVLNWESFAVFVLEKDIPNLKRILLSIPEKRYLELQMGVKRVQQHFLWHARPVKYDIFHMILHSIWYNRLHQIRPR